MDHTEELYELLKEGIDTTPSTSTGADEQESVDGTTQLYEDPPQVETTPPDDDNPQEHTTGAEEEHKKVRQGVLDNAFEGRGNADKADQALVSQNFSHGAAGDFTTHSVHLQGRSVEKVSYPRSPTLREQVRKITGQF